MGHHRGSFTDDSPPILTKIETSNTDGDGHPTVIPNGYGDEKLHTEQFSQEMCKVQHVVGRFGFRLTV